MYVSVMCRLYAHTLLVLDDDDFYECQDMFTLAQQRGIATALNALVFRTYCPLSLGKTLTDSHFHFPAYPHCSSTSKTAECMS